MLFRLFLTTFLLTFIGCSSSLKPLAIQSTAPATKFQLIDGSYVTLSELRGKTVALLFWSTSCSPSKRAIIDLSRQVRDMVPRPDLYVLAVNIDEDRAKVEQVIKFNKLERLNHAFSGNGVYDEAYISFRGSDLPMAVLIGPKGEIIAQGKELDLSEM